MIIYFVRIVDWTDSFFMIIIYFYRLLVYRREFTLPSQWTGSNVRINFEVSILS